MKKKQEEERPGNEEVRVEEVEESVPARELEGKEEAPKKRGKQKKAKGRKKGLRILAGIMCALVVIGVIVATNFQAIAMALGFNAEAFEGDLLKNQKIQMFNTKATLYDNLNPEENFANQNVLNILVFGMDQDVARTGRYDTFRPDTIMVASINLETKSVSLVSIPRDTYCDIYRVGNGRSSGKDKVNACFYYGSISRKEGEGEFDAGVRTLKDTVSKLLGGIPINYYIGINMDGLAVIIDMMGGVKVNVHVNIPTSGIYVGERVLSGEQFLTYARHREYSGGDIDRVKVQQRLLTELFKQLKEQSVFKLPSIIAKAYDMLYTDITFKQAMSLGMTMMEDFDASSIKTATIPGTFGNLRGISYWIVIQSQRVSFIYEHYGIKISPGAQDPTYIPKPVQDPGPESLPDTDEGGGD